MAVPESAGKLLHDRLNEPQITQISQKQEKLPPGVTELLDEVHDRSMPLKICVDWLPKVDSSIGEVRSFFVPQRGQR